MKRFCIDRGKEHLLSCIQNGLCLEFHQLRHGPSVAWTTTCVGSALAEFQAVPDEMIGSVLALQWECGGWSYNQSTPPDPDSTLRALQFLRKAGVEDRQLVKRAEQFVMSHQLENGGIATYLPETVTSMGYPVGGWTESHPCVTALAGHVLQDSAARVRARQYIRERLAQSDARSYWWQTPYYVRYEAGSLDGEPVGEDVVEIALALLLKAKLGIAWPEQTEKLRQMQLEDGSFPSSHQFRIPRPTQHIDEITSEVELIEDRRRVFSTSAAIVAVSRQEVLLN